MQKQQQNQQKQKIELIDTLWTVNQDRKKMVETTGFEN